VNAPAASANVAGAHVADVFFVTAWALGPYHYIDATRAEAEALRGALAALRNAVAIEQKVAFRQILARIGE
jgi:hypothetical protein